LQLKTCLPDRAAIGAWISPEDPPDGDADPRDSRKKAGTLARKASLTSLWTTAVPIPEVELAELLRSAAIIGELALEKRMGSPYPIPSGARNR
jgi:hypothetical protein